MTSRKKMITRAFLRTKNKTQNILHDTKGLSHTVEVICIIIIVVVIIAVVFGPQISNWFTKTVMPSLNTQTTNLFNFKG